MEDRGPASWRQSLHHVGDRARPDTGKLKFYHQELPHDAWDFDSAVGEFVMIDRGGKQSDGASEQGRLRVRLRPQQRQGRERLAAGPEHQLREGHRPEDRRADRPPRHGRGLAQEPLPGDRRRHQLEHRHLQPEDRPLLQGRQRMVHGSRRREDDADPRADGAAQHRRELQADQPPKAARPMAISTRAIRSPAQKKWEVEFHEPPLASLLVDRRQPGVRAGCARHAARLRRHDRQGTVVAQRRHRPCRRHHQLRGRRQAVHCRDDGLGILVGDEYAALFGGPYPNMANDTGAIVVFALQ